MSTKTERNSIIKLLRDTIGKMRPLEAFDVETRAELATVWRIAREDRLNFRTRKLNSGGWTIIYMGKKQQ